MLRVGLISDTHGLLRPQAEQFLRACDHIVHAGDIVKADILERLSAFAPLTAVRGNNDAGDWAAALPYTQTLNLGGVTLFVLHDLHDLHELKIRIPPRGVQVIVCGHSHQPKVTPDAAGVLIVNPGSAGPRRFKLPVTAAELIVEGPHRFHARIVDLLEPVADATGR